MNKEYQEGRRARERGRAISNNPFPRHELGHRCWWAAGWNDRDMEMADRKIDKRTLKRNWLELLNRAKAQKILSGGSNEIKKIS